jgi:hypothetical protein
LTDAIDADSPAAEAAGLTRSSMEPGRIDEMIRRAEGLGHPQNRRLL